MKKRIHSICIIGAIILGFFGLRWYRTETRIIQGSAEGIIIGYEESDEGIILIVQEEWQAEDGTLVTGSKRCLVTEETLFNERCAYLLDHRITGAPVIGTTNHYRACDGQRPDYLFTMVTLGIRPDYWQELIEQGIIREEDFDAYMETYTISEAIRKDMERRP